MPGVALEIREFPWKELMVPPLRLKPVAFRARIESERLIVDDGLA